jgi:hypothetical protein
MPELIAMRLLVLMRLSSFVTTQAEHLARIVEMLELGCGERLRHAIPLMARRASGSVRRSDLTPRST